MPGCVGGLVTEETSTGSQEVQGTWCSGGTCRQGLVLCRALLGALKVRRVSQAGPFAIQGDPAQEHWLVLRHLGLEVQ